jgi:mannose-6-phosphate isomerase-like protein (cupin superfamily)
MRAWRLVRAGAAALAASTRLSGYDAAPMLTTGDSFRSARGSHFAIIEGPADNDGARLVWERVLPPGTGNDQPHIHADCDERFEVTSGTATMQQAGVTKTLGPGESIVFTRGTAHRNPYNASSSELVFRGEITPCPPFIDAFVRLLREQWQSGKANSQDQISMLDILLLSREYDGQTYGAGAPIWLQKAILPLGVMIARATGHRLPTDE